MKGHTVIKGNELKTVLIIQSLFGGYIIKIYPYVVGPGCLLDSLATSANRGIFSPGTKPSVK